MPANRFGKSVVLPCGCECTTHLADPPQLQTQYGLSDLYLEYTYLPSVTSYPWAPDWSPDAQYLAFSMLGSIWKVRLDTGEARELTHSAYYDSQPCWDRVRNCIVFVRDTGHTIDLWEVNTDGTDERQLTDHNAVSVNPRCHPEGGDILYTSNWSSDSFRLMALDVLTREPRVLLALPSSHCLAADWTGDGESVTFQCNAALAGVRAYGAGYLYRLSLRPPSIPTLLLKEELFHTAMPRNSPVSNTIAYISQRSGKTYLRYADATNGNPTDYDEVLTHAFTPSWSPDGSRIVFVSAQRWPPRLVVVDYYSGQARTVVISDLSYKVPFGTLRLSMTDEHTNSATSARIYIRASDGKYYSPQSTIHRQSQATGDHYSYCFERCEVVLPAGPAAIDVMHGFEYEPFTMTIDVPEGGCASIECRLRRVVNLPSEGWYSGDTHVHLSYGGTLAKSDERFMLESEAEGLNVVNILVANRDNTLLDYQHFRADPIATNSRECIAVFGEEFRPLFAGHMDILRPSSVITPSYVGYPGTAYAADYPANSHVSDLAHARGAFCGYAHPFYLSDKDPSEYDYRGARELPADVALGKVDFYDVLCTWSFESASAAVWYRLLNLGFRLPASAGTDCFLDFWRTPAVGGTRVYVKCGHLEYEAWLGGLLQGRSFVTNGPIIFFSVNGISPGDTLHVSPDSHIKISASVFSIVPVFGVDILYNGRVVSTQPRPTNCSEFNFTMELAVPFDGWVAARVTGPSFQHYVVDSEVWAHTSPVYILTGNADPIRQSDAEYFVRWCERCIALLMKSGVFSDEEQRQATLQVWERALALYNGLARRTSATGS